jgi:hypothetical protein
MIQRSLGEPSVQNGSLAVPREGQEMIDSADAEARTPEETAVVSTLNAFYVGRLMNNLERDVIKGPSYNAASEAAAQTKLANDPQAIEMSKREANCSASLNDILRSRHYSVKPDICFAVQPPKAAPAK